MDLNVSLFESFFLHLTHTILRLTEGESDHDQAFYRIERIGYQVGLRFMEGLFAARSDRIGDHLEVVKFLCQDVWKQLFKKQIDGLKTNHRGVFVLTDNDFSWVSRFGVDPTSPDTVQMAILVRHKLNVFSIWHIRVVC